MADIPEPTPESPVPPSPPPPRKEGMSTAAKVAIGCGIVAAIVIVLLVIAGVAGGLFIRNKAEEFAGGMEAQEEASATLSELEREHPFTAPPDGVVGEDRAERFFDATDTAWEGMEEEMTDLAGRGEEIDRRGGEAGFRDAMAGLQGLGRARLALADALEDAEMPVSEYLWTGLVLLQAYENLDRPAGESGVPAANLDLAADHRAELAELSGEGDEGRADKSVVLGVAWTLGMTGDAAGTMGLDTLGRYAPRAP